MTRRTQWNARYGKPYSKGGSVICDKHDFIESNSDDPEMAYEIAQAARAALEDGQAMEHALRDRKERIEELERDLADAEERIRELEAQLAQTTNEVTA